MSKGSKPRPYSVPLKEFNNNFDVIFRKDKRLEEEAKQEDEEFDRINHMQVRVKEDQSKVGQCGCGRSPTGKCIGWHGLTEEAFKEKLEEYKLNEGK
jgi:hypothetical protein